MRSNLKCSNKRLIYCSGLISSSVIRPCCQPRTIVSVLRTGTSRMLLYESCARPPSVSWYSGCFYRRDVGMRGFACWKALQRLQWQPINTADRHQSVNASHGCRSDELQMLPSCFHQFHHDLSTRWKDRVQNFWLQACRTTDVFQL